MESSSLPFRVPGVYTQSFRIFSSTKRKPGFVRPGYGRTATHSETDQ